MRSDTLLHARRMQPASFSVAGGGLAPLPAKPKSSSSNCWNRLTSMLRRGNMSAGITLHVRPHLGQRKREIEHFPWPSTFLNRE
ncbi:MAG: hypothetical protein WCP06_13825 [Verrucomicrobiota bacterium]